MSEAVASRYLPLGEENKRLLMNSMKLPSWHNVFLGFLVSFLPLLFPVCSMADVYRFVDENGVTHLTNIPMGPQFRIMIREGEQDLDSTSGVKLKSALPVAPYDALIAETAEKYGVDSALVKAVIRAESNFNRRAVSKKGAKGLMQLMPETALALGVDDCYRPEDNIDGGIRHLSRLIGLYSGDLRLVLAAYNAGEGAVTRYSGIPPFSETRSYVRQVLDHYASYRKQSAISAATSHP
jgi:hypothetical protein